MSQTNYKMTEETYKQLCNPTPIIKYYFLINDRVKSNKR